MRRSSCCYIQILLCFFIFSCQSTKDTSTKNKSSGGITKIDVGDNWEEEELKEDPKDTEGSAEESIRNWGIWIRGVGIDSFAGLGFLQQLEAQGIRPNKIAGTGMGCWIALSWALRNRGNYAEWQASKFDSWQGFHGQLLGRGSKSSHKEKFLDYLAQLRKSQKQSFYEIPLECPLFEQKTRELSLAHELLLEERLYKQFDLPILEFGNTFDEIEYQSGATQRTFNEKFLESLSEEFRNYESQSVWIIVETAPSRRLWRSEPGVSTGISKSGIRWIQVQLGGKLAFTAQQLKDFKLRRRWLLEGRRDAKIILAEPDIKEFLKL